jgi:hypothetical protein
LAGAFLAATFFLVGAFLAMVTGSLSVWRGGQCRLSFGRRKLSDLYDRC